MNLTVSKGSFVEVESKNRHVVLLLLLFASVEFSNFALFCLSGSAVLVGEHILYNIFIICQDPLIIPQESDII